MQVTRRSFYNKLITGLGTLMGVVLAAPAGVYLFASNRSKRPGGFVEAAKLTELQIGNPREVTFERVRVDGWRTFREKAIAWVVRTGDTSVVAYSPQCTHLGCAYHWEAQRDLFVCPCHGSLFTIGGKVAGGPAPRPLDRYAVCVENDKLLIGSQVERA